jgi:hypothetical protein
MFIPVNGTGLMPSASRRGRVTLDDDRWLATDIFSRDSKECMPQRFNSIYDKL